MTIRKARLPTLSFISAKWNLFRGVANIFMTYKIIRDQQQVWARQRGIKFDQDGYTLFLDDNLLLPLIPEVKKEFQSGKGDELGSGERRGKMQALHSSAALMVNIFQYRANRNVGDITLA